MIIDGAAATAGAVPRTDVCVVGSGPAGMALATRLLRLGRSVLVVESGPLTLEQWAADLNAGEDRTDLRFGFQVGRRRVVGGNDGLWWGQCVRLEDEDFTARSWVPLSGWPIGPADLAGTYAEAEEWFGVADRPTGADLDRGLRVPPAFEGAAGLERRTTVFSRRHRHTQDFLAACRADGRAHLLHSATAVGLTMDGARVTGVRTRSPGGLEREILADSFVLAGGGVENPRLLLAADRDLGGRLDPHGVVGRYLHEHPSVFQARVVGPGVAAIQREFALRYKARHRFWPKLMLSAAAQEKHGALGATAALVTRFGPDSGVEALKALVGQARARKFGPDALRQAGRVVREGGSLPRFVAERVRGYAPTSATRAQLLVQVQLEQEPEAVNRVTLSDRLDAQGVPMAAVELRISDQTRHSLDVVTQTLDEELQVRGLGRLSADLGGAVAPEEQWALAQHHAGTTRMSVDPVRGVVDADCRVHGTGNLFVAGSSVFPTSGWGNPTLTIVALAFRLAEHLDRELPRR